MNPRLKFIYSSLYYSNMFGHAISAKDAEMTKRKIARFEKRWKQVGEKILTELSRVSKIRWAEKEIEVYVLPTKRINFSSPLTINAHLPIEDAIDVLTHELIHRILGQSTRSKASWRGVTPLFRQYMKSEGLTVYVHILVHALHEHIYRKIRGLARLRQDRAKCKHHKDYQRAWEVVDELGYMSVIKAVRGKK